MNPTVTNYLLDKYGKKNPPQVQAGETVRVHQRIKEGNKERVQIFEGLVIATKHGLGLDGTFTVRKLAAGAVGVEKTYPVHSPNIIKVERIKKAEVSRAKLYYMRDRKGKSARFKQEGPSYLTWSEAAVVAEVENPPAEEPEMTEEPVVEPEMEEAVAEVPEEVTKEEPEAAEETPTEEVAVAEPASEELAAEENTEESNEKAA